jgi:toxin ParE1/3/4
VAHSSPEIAIGYVRRIQEACLGLATFPKRGHRRDDILPGLRVVGFERRVSIAFRVLKTRVEIVSIAYGGRDFEREPRKGKIKQPVGPCDLQRHGADESRVKRLRERYWHGLADGQA